MSQVTNLNNGGNFPPGSAVQTLTGNNASEVVGPDSLNNIDILGSGGITVTGDESLNRLTISSVAGGFTWFVQPVDTTAVSGTGYFCDGAAQVIITLPVASAVGDTFAVYSLNGNGWGIAQGAGQFIQIGFDDTPVGAGTFLASEEVGDCMTFVCAIANTEWCVISSVGSAGLTF